MDFLKDLLKFENPKVNFSKADSETEGTDTETSVDSGSNTNTGTSTGSRSRDPATTEGGSTDPDRFESKGKAGESEPKETHYNEDSSSSDDTFPVDTSVDTKPEPRSSSVDLSFLDNADIFTSPKSNEIKNTEPEKVEQKADIGIEEDDKKKKTPSEVVDETLTFDKNTFDNAKVDLENAPANLLGTSGTLTDIFKDDENEIATGGIQNPNQAPNIVGNIQGMEAAGENEYNRLSKEFEEKAEANSTLAENLRKIDDEYSEGVLRFREDVQKFFRDRDSLIQKAVNEGNVTQEEYDALEARRLELLKRSDELGSLKEAAEEESRRVREENDKHVKESDELHTKMYNVLNSLPAYNIPSYVSRIGKDNLAQSGRDFNKFAEDWSDWTRTMDARVSGLYDNTDNTKNAIENAIKEMRVPKEQLDNMITSNEKYFDYIRRTGQQFDFDDWAKDSGIVGKLAQAGAIVGGGAVAGSLGYRTIKDFIENKVNDKLYQETGVARTDKQQVQNIETSLNNLNKYTETQMDEETAKAIGSVYEKDRKQFEDYYNKVREEYKEWFADKIDESGKVRELSPSEYSKAAELNREMSKLNDYKKQYNEIEDKIGYTETEETPVEKYISSNDGNEYTREELEKGSEEFWNKLSTPRDKAYYIMHEASNIDPEATGVEGGGDVSFDLVEEFQNYLSNTYGNGYIYYSTPELERDLSKALEADDPQVKEYFQQIYNEAQGIYSPDFGTGKAAKAIVGLNENAKRYGQKQGQFYNNSIIDLPDTVANYYDDFDMDATMSNNASPEAMKAKYQEYWDKASDEQKILAQVVEKLEPKDRGEFGWWNNKNKYSWGADYSQTLDISDNGKEWLVAQILDNKRYADAVIEGRVGSNMKELYEYANGLPDDPSEVKVTNYFVSALGSKLANEDYQTIYDIYKLIEQQDPNSILRDDSTVDASEGDFGKDDYQDIYDIGEDELPAEENANGKEATSESVEATEDTTGQQKELTEEELAKIFGIAYDESKKSKNEYNRGLTNENAYSDEDVKTFVTGNKKDPIFRAFVNAVRNYK